MVKEEVDKSEDIGVNKVSKLHLCLSNDNLDRLKKSISDGETDLNDKIGALTPLGYAAKNSKKEILNYLLRFSLELGININEKDLEGNTPLHLAASSGTLDTVSLLLKYGADPNIRDKDDFCSFGNAIFKESLDCCFLLFSVIDRSSWTKDYSNKLCDRIIGGIKFKEHVYGTIPGVPRPTNTNKEGWNKLLNIIKGISYGRGRS